MATKKKKKNNKKSQSYSDKESLILVVLGIIIGLIVYTDDQGGIGYAIKNVLLGGIMGRLAYALPVILIIYGLYIIFRDKAKFKLRSVNLIMLMILIASTITCFDNYPYLNDKPENILVGIGNLCVQGMKFQGGGLLGAIISVPLEQFTNMITTKVIIIIALILFAMAVCGIAFSSIIIGISSFFGKVIEKGRDLNEARLQREYDEYAEDDEEDEEEYEEEEEVEEEIPVEKKIKNKKFQHILEQTEIVGPGRQMKISDLPENMEVEEAPEDEVEPDNMVTDLFEEEEELEEEAPVSKASSHRDNKKVRELFVKKKVEKEPNTAEVLQMNHLETSDENYDNYVFPPVSLLSEVQKLGQEYSVKELRDVATKLQNTLTSFNVDAKVVNVTRGPTVTQYEIQPNVGVKVSKIFNLVDDIALNLAAKTIRIEAPIPGKSAVGIEVPNRTKETVWLREVIESDAFRDAKSKVSFALGKSIEGEPFVSDIAKMPHMLIAGSTGSGKSVCINSILISLLYKAKPNEVKLILIDPKVVELGVYNGIPHLLIPVVTDPKKAAGALNWAVQEMVNRYNLFAARGVRDIRGYNDLLTQEGEDGILPQIVIIVDELADLMMVAPKEVEDAICRLAQMARAAGMHLIIATQRPSVDVVTGIIKANIPSRIAFTVQSQIDSRTILDMAGAEKLLGKGDMLYYPIGEEKPIRVQGTFVTDKEIETIVEFVKRNGVASYDPNIIESFENANKSPQAKAEKEESDCDEFLLDAIELAVQMGNASASMIQRKFKVGYARAGRIIDQMEERGIISGYEGAKPRKTLISKEEWENMKEEGIDSVQYEDIDEEDNAYDDSDETEYEDSEYEEETEEIEDDEEVEESDEDSYEEETESDEDDETEYYEESEDDEDSSEEESDDETEYDEEYEAKDNRKYI